MAVYKIKKGELPAKNKLSKESMINYIVENGTETDLDWLEEQYNTITKSQTLAFKDDKPLVSVPDVAKIRNNFLERFFAEELAAKKNAKTTTKPNPFEIARKKMQGK